LRLGESSPCWRWLPPPSRTATSIEAEVARLGLLVEQLRQSEAESRRLNDLLQKRAYTDELTGLANRTRLEEYVEALLRSSPPGCFALACIQLQNFKHINDYYTSPVGDELLRRVAHRIAVIARGSDVLARTGGDEFGLLLKNNDAQLHASVARLAEQLRERFVLSEAIESIGALDEAYGPDKTISINVAAKQAGDVNFMRGLLDTLAQSGFAERFIIEVTEDAFIATREFQAQILPMLRELGRARIHR
jgi:diguanylate cyclase (GGDEF)-like protein